MTDLARTLSSTSCLLALEEKVFLAAVSGAFPGPFLLTGKSVHDSGE